MAEAQPDSVEDDEDICDEEIREVKKIRKKLRQIQKLERLNRNLNEEEEVKVSGIRSKLTPCLFLADFISIFNYSTVEHET